MHKNLCMRFKQLRNRFNKKNAIPKKPVQRVVGAANLRNAPTAFHNDYFNFLTSTLKSTPATGVFFHIPFSKR